MAASWPLPGHVRPPSTPRHLARTPPRPLRFVPRASQHASKACHRVSGAKANAASPNRAQWCKANRSPHPKSCWPSVSARLRLERLTSAHRPFASPSQQQPSLMHALCPLPHFSIHSVAGKSARRLRSAHARHRAAPRPSTTTPARKVSSPLRLQHESPPAKSEPCENNAPHRCALIYLAAASQHGARAAAT
jgi:hypothetical protein